MKYCQKCKHVSFSDDDKCECGARFVKKIDYDSPVHVITAQGSDRLKVQRIFSKINLPFSELDLSGYSPAVGKIGDEAQYFVPLGLIAEAIDALSNAGMITKPDWYDKIEVPDDYVWREMSERRRMVVRVLSIIVFLGLIWACVTGVDLLVDIFTSTF